ncbi:MAG: 4Fe-4S binding protein [Thermoanaerobaculia bacterium]
MKKLRERAPKDISQSIRLAMQLAFALLNLWIGIEFARWVTYIETPGSTFAPRPAGVEGWLPIAGLMNLKYWIATRSVPHVHAAAMFLFVAFLLIAVLLKKAFCSWLCPVGTISEWLWKLGHKIAKRNLMLPKWLDIPLRGLKYLLLGFFLWTIVRMPALAIDEFMRAPYGAITDIKLLHFFRFIGTTGLTVIAVLLALSVAIPNFWCRYACPYGAMLGLASLFSPTQITRDANECIDCAKCAKACPSRLPVDVLPRVRSAECTLCMSCVAVCPAKNALQVKVVKRRTMPAWAIAATIATIFLGIVIAARVTGHWDRHVPDEVVRYFLSLG